MSTLLVSLRGARPERARRQCVAGAKGIERGADAGAADRLISSKPGDPARAGSGIANHSVFCSYHKQYPVSRNGPLTVWGPQWS